MFKKPPSTSKRRCNYEKKQTTLDACHQQHINSFNENYLRSSSNAQRLEELHQRRNRETDPIAVFKLDEEITSLSTELSKSNEEEIDYYSNTADILYHYYDSIEKDDTSKSYSSSPSIAETLLKTNNANGGKSILEFFIDKHKNVATPSSSSEENNQTPVVVNKPTQTKPMNRAYLYDKFLNETDQNYVKCIEDDDPNICEYCNSDEIVIMTQEGMMFCNMCSSVKYIIVDNDKPSYKEPQKEISYLNYKRKNHFNEWLNQIQGKETTEIPEEVFNSILLEIKKLRITNMAEVTHSKIREILKRLRYSKFYEHTPYIYYRITGIPNQYLSSELEEKLRNMFELIQVPFLKHSPRNRKNFLSYSYCIHKMLELLGEDKYLPYFPLLRNREKRMMQEQIWKKICEELGWQFIPSM
jgi:uncharacterized Zn finger protein (UPF0148 family)